VCAECALQSQELDGVSSLLAAASVHYEAIPEQFSVRIEAALAAESSHRLASEPETEAGRRDLPTRARPEGRRAGQLWGFRFSGPAARVLAAAGALVIVGAGGYEIATHVTPGASSTSAPSSSSRRLPSAAGLHAAGAGIAQGPNVTYQSQGHFKSVTPIATETDFKSNKLGGQVLTMLAAASEKGAIPSAAGRAPSPLNSTSSPSVPIPDSFGTLNRGQLAGCIAEIAGARAVLLVDLAEFNGRRATIIVLGVGIPNPAVVWVVGTACGPTNRDVLAHLTLSHS
jgi:hypothetical protein